MKLIKPKTRIYYYKPWLADFPESEYKARINKAQKLMKKANLDLMLFFGEDNVFYFTGFRCTHWRIHSLQPGIAMIPQDGAPTLISPQFFQPVDEGTSWVKDQRFQELAHLDRNERLLPQLVADVAKEKGFEDRTISMGDSAHSMFIPRPLIDIDTFRKSLPKAKWDLEKGGHVAWECRSIKSPTEIDRLKTAAEITGHAYEVVHCKVKVGMTEREVATIYRTALFEYGGEDINFFYMATGKERYPMYDSPPYDVEVKNGDTLTFDGGCIYRMYRADVARTFYCGGSITDKHRELHKQVEDAQDAGIDAIKPGAKVSDIAKALNKVLRKGGWGGLPDVCGHGIGLENHEWPVINEEMHVPIKPGMVFTIEPWIMHTWPKPAPGVAEIYNPKWPLGIYALEDLVLVNQKGRGQILPSFDRGFLTIR